MKQQTYTAFIVVKDFKQECVWGWVVEGKGKKRRVKEKDEKKVNKEREDYIGEYQRKVRER